MDDLIIIGGSAAGSAAGIYAARRNLRVRVLAGDLGGEVARSGEVENWPGVVHTTGIELAVMFEKHLKSYDVPIEVGVWVTQVTRKNEMFVITAKNGDQELNFQAKTVIVATGVHPRELTIPGEKELKNKGVSYCTVCDGPLYRGKRVATIGGGNSALESALMLASFAQEVTLITKNPRMKGEAVLIDKLEKAANVHLVTNAKTIEIQGTEFVTGLMYSDSDTNQEVQLPVDGVFVHIGMVPNSTFLPDVTKNQFGEIEVNTVGETNIPGLFAAGDVTNHPYKQIAIATGHGVTAALQAARYLDNLAY